MCLHSSVNLLRCAARGVSGVHMKISTTVLVPFVQRETLTTRHFNVHCVSCAGIETMKILPLLLSCVMASSAFVRQRPAITDPFRAMTALFASSSNPLANSRLSRIMLNVPDVDKTVAFWKAQGGTLIFTRPKADGTLSSAIVALGDEKSWYDGLSLEFEETEGSEFNFGNTFGEIALCLPKPEPASGDEAGEVPAAEPNGIDVRSHDDSSADYFCRVSLRTNDLEASKNFYLQLGMSVVDSDGYMVCLRYKTLSDDVPATFLVLEATDEEIGLGNCLEQLEIQTSDCLASRDYLEAADMPIEIIPDIDLDLFGIVDPNGYHIVVAGAYG